RGSRRARGRCTGRQSSRSAAGRARRDPAGAPSRRTRASGMSRRARPRPSRRPRPLPGSLARPGALDVHRVDDGLLAAAAELAERAPEDLQVEAERPVVDVPDVLLDPLGPADRLAAVYLRPARDPRLDSESTAVVLGVVLRLLDEVRPRPDQAHLAAEDVPELRQLVEA